jgi:long-chain acyl-CoA synthetase
VANRAHGLLRQASERGERTALQFENRRISFRELAELACEAAGGLKSLGVGHGTRVGIMLPSQPEFVIVQQALFLLGAIVSPINIYYRPGEVAHAIKSCDLQFVVLAKDLCDRLPVHLRDETPLLLGAILVDTHEELLGYLSLPRACAVSSPVTTPEPVDSKDVVMLLNTSATTGKSKGVMLTAGNLAANYDRTPEWLRLSADDVILCALPLYNTFGLNQCINAMTAIGATLVLLPRFDAAKCIRSIERYQCTFLPAVPTMLQKMIDHLGTRTSALRSLRLIMTGGAPVPAPLRARLKGVLDETARVVTGYGLTEATALVTLADVDLGVDGKVQRGRTIGRVLDSMWLGVIDDNGQPLGPGQIGELAIRGPNLMAGYYRAPDDTAAALVDGTLRTGDIGYLDEEGYAYIVDRKKDIIIRGGQNIYPADIEEVLYGVLGVAEVAVVGVEDSVLGEVPIAYVALAPACAVSAEALLARCREELASYKQPSAVIFMTELPKGPTGKILRRALRQKAAENKAA